MFFSTLVQTATILSPLTFCAPTPQFAVASSTPGGFSQSCVNGVCQASANGVPLDVGGTSVVPSIPSSAPATNPRAPGAAIGGADPAAGLATPVAIAGGGGFSPAAFVSNFFNSLGNVPGAQVAASGGGSATSCVNGQCTFA